VVVVTSTKIQLILFSYFPPFFFNRSRRLCTTIVPHTTTHRPSPGKERESAQRSRVTTANPQYLAKRKSFDKKMPPIDKFANGRKEDT